MLQPPSTSLVANHVTNSARSETAVQRHSFGRTSSRRSIFLSDANKKFYATYKYQEKLRMLPGVFSVVGLYALTGTLMELTNLTGGHVMRLLLFAVLLFLVMVLLTMTTIITSERVTTMVTVFLWLITTSSLLIDVGSTAMQPTAADATGWFVIMIFVTFLVMPWDLKWSVGHGVLLALGNIPLLWYAWPYEGDGKMTISEQISAKLLLFIGAILFGMITFFSTHRKQRLSFLEISQLLHVGVSMEREYKKQKWLLLCLLPKQIVEELLADMKRGKGLFSNVYTLEYDNVSILFATLSDVSAITSLTASELTRLLNTIFVSFDREGKKYHQMRIKIVGSCYHSICGADSQSRHDHASLTVYMGLAMIDVVSHERKGTKKDIHVRVGIHSGSVLGGVWGQRPWQFDVTGRGVMIAEKIERSGIQGRLHISEMTKQRLHDMFELEPGQRWTRDEYLRQNKINTYFVMSARVPFHSEEKMQNTSADEEDAIPFFDSDESAPASDRPEQHLNRILSDRNSHLADKMHPVMLWFYDRQTEIRYEKGQGQFSRISIVGLCVVLFFAVTAQMFILPKSLIRIGSFILGECTLLLMSTISVSSAISWNMPSLVVNFTKLIRHTPFMNTLWGVLAVVIMLLTSVMQIMECDVEKAAARIKNLTLALVEPEDSMCAYPSFYILSDYLLLLGVAFAVQLGLLLRVTMICFSLGIFHILYLMLYPALFEYYDAIVFSSIKRFLPLRLHLYIHLFSASLAIMVLIRMMEKEARGLFLCHEEAHQENHRLASLRHKNFTIVLNMFPPHVAKDFLEHRQGDDDLPSQFYSNAGVMVSSCPGFQDFLNEIADSSKDLKGLQLLNELIIEFDNLLKKKYKSLTKIRTFGTSYTVASGISECNMSKPSQENCSREFWQHLDVLIRFVFSMREALDHINETSFKRFSLRTGICHGPVVAGIIGGPKPHYDIWGSTVTMACDLEATGLPGTIQVNYETKEILEKFDYAFRNRGLIRINDRDEVETYLLEDKLSKDNTSFLMGDVDVKKEEMPTRTNTHTDEASKKPMTPLQHSLCSGDVDKSDVCYNSTVGTGNVSNHDATDYNVANVSDIVNNNTITRADVYSTRTQLDPNKSAVSELAMSVPVKSVQDSRRPDNRAANDSYGEIPSPSDINDVSQGTPPATRSVPPRKQVEQDKALEMFEVFDPAGENKS